MVRQYFGAAFFLAFAACCAPPVFGADKKNDKKPPEAIDADTLPPGKFTGKLKTPPGSDGALIVSIEYQHLVLKHPGKKPKNPNKPLQKLLHDQQHIANLQQQLVNSRSAHQQVLNMQHLQQAMNQFQIDLVRAQLSPDQNPFTLKTDSKDVTFHAAEDMKVRFNSPPSAFDEKGNPKKYTADELKELKGKGDDAKLVGYEGSVEKLTAGMPVRVTTIRFKPKKEEKKPENKDVDKDKDVAADPKDAGPKTVVSLLLVLGDENSGTGSDSTDPKKKKKNN